MSASQWHLHQRDLMCSCILQRTSSQKLMLQHLLHNHIPVQKIRDGKWVDLLHESIYIKHSDCPTNSLAIPLLWKDNYNYMKKWWSWLKFIMVKFWFEDPWPRLQNFWAVENLHWFDPIKKLSVWRLFRLMKLINWLNSIGSAFIPSCSSLQD